MSFRSRARTLSGFRYALQIHRPHVSWASLSRMACAAAQLAWDAGGGVALGRLPLGPVEVDRALTVVGADDAEAALAAAWRLGGSADPPPGGTPPEGFAERRGYAQRARGVRDAVRPYVLPLTVRSAQGYGPLIQGPFVERYLLGLLGPRGFLPEETFALLAAWSTAAAVAEAVDLALLNVHAGSPGYTGPDDVGTTARLAADALYGLGERATHRGHWVAEAQVLAAMRATLPPPRARIRAFLRGA